MICRSFNSALSLPRATQPAAREMTMQRWHLERPIMVKRWREEWEYHGRNFGNCHCGLGMGTMRKHRPAESHPSKSCRLCALERDWNRQEKRRERHAARQQIIEGMSE